MYKDFFRLSEEPFSPDPDPKFFLLTPTHQAALKLMLYGITQRQGFVLLTGESGTGKTALIQKLLQTLDPSIKAIAILHPPGSFLDLLEIILRSLKIRLEERKESVLGRQFIDYISHGAGQDGNLVIIADNAQELSKEFLEKLRELWNPRPGKLQEVLAGRPQIEDKLNSWDMRQLKQRIAIRCRLKPLNEAESLQYIEHRITLAGGRTPEIFDSQALSLICRHSGGNPGKINILCTKALWAGYSLAKKPVDFSTTKEIFEDSGLLPPEKPTTSPHVKKLKTHLPPHRPERDYFAQEFVTSQEYLYGNMHGFPKNAFDPHPDPRLFFITENVRETWNSILFGIAQRKRFILVTGESGTGKTTLIALLFLYLTTRFKKVIPLFHPLNNIEAILETILQNLGFPAEKESKGSMISRLNEDLTRRSIRDENITLIFDEAQNLRKETLREIRLLMNSSPNSPKVLQEVFVGDLRFEKILRSRDLSGLNQGFEVRCRLRPFTAEESLRYIEHRLTKAGSAMSKVFTPRALSLITQSSGGIPHQINQICSEAIGAGYSQMKERIESSNVREALVNLGLKKRHGRYFPDKALAWVKRSLGRD